MVFKPTYLQGLSSFLCPDNDIELTGHKEESNGRMADREWIKMKLQECIDPMNPEGHPPKVVNIAIGQIAQDNVYVDKAVELGSKQMMEFENGWPKNFNDKLSRVVKTQVESGKYIKVGDTKVFNTELIYTRLIGIQASSWWTAAVLWVVTSTHSNVFRILWNEGC